MEILLSAARNNDYEFTFYIKGNLIFNSSFERININPLSGFVTIQYKYNGFAKGQLSFECSAKYLVAEWQEMGGVLRGNGYFEAEYDTNDNVVLLLTGEWGDLGYVSPNSKGRKGCWGLVVRKK